MARTEEADLIDRNGHRFCRGWKDDCRRLGSLQFALRFGVAGSDSCKLLFQLVVCQTLAVEGGLQRSQFGVVGLPVMGYIEV